MDGRDVDTVIELLLIAKNLQQLRDEGRIGDDIFLAEVGVGFTDA